MIFASFGELYSHEIMVIADNFISFPENVERMDGACDACFGGGDSRRSMPRLVRVWSLSFAPTVSEDSLMRAKHDSQLVRCVRSHRISVQYVEPERAVQCTAAR